VAPWQRSGNVPRGHAAGDNLPERLETTIQDGLPVSDDDPKAELARLKEENRRQTANDIQAAGIEKVRIRSVLSCF
jgi:hypothetical protein